MKPVAISGLGTDSTATPPQRAPWIMWGAIIALTGLIFYGTLREPRRKRS